MKSLFFCFVPFNAVFFLLLVYTIILKSKIKIIRSNLIEISKLYRMKTEKKNYVYLFKVLILKLSAKTTQLLIKKILKNYLLKKRTYIYS